MPAAAGGEDEGFSPGDEHSFGSRGVERPLSIPVGLRHSARAVFTSTDQPAGSDVSGHEGVCFHNLTEVKCFQVGVE